MSFAELSEAIAKQSGIQLDARSTIPVSGGDINVALRIQDAQGTNYFLKLNHSDRVSMFEADRKACWKFSIPPQCVHPSPSVWAAPQDRHSF